MFAHEVEQWYISALGFVTDEVRCFQGVHLKSILFFGLAITYYSILRVFLFYALLSFVSCKFMLRQVQYKGCHATKTKSRTIQ